MVRRGAARDRLFLASCLLHSVPVIGRRYFVDCQLDELGFLQKELYHFQRSRRVWLVAADAFTHVAKAVPVGGPVATCNDDWKSPCLAMVKRDGTHAIKNPTGDDNFLILDAEGQGSYVGSSSSWTTLPGVGMARATT